jgi:hypothetical protein
MIYGNGNKIRELLAKPTVRNSQRRSSFRVEDATTLYGRISLFTPKIALDVKGKRTRQETGTTNQQGKKQLVCELDKNSHGTFFSFFQIGMIFQSKNINSELNYSFGNPQPFIQNKGAHGDGYRFPLFNPDAEMNPKQSKPSIGFNLIFK